MTSEGLGEMFEGDSADTCVRKFPLVSMGGRAEGHACADPGARTLIGASGNYVYIIIPVYIIPDTTISFVIISIFWKKQCLTFYKLTNYDYYKSLTKIYLFHIQVEEALFGFVLQTNKVHQSALSAMFL